jgi:hypothetical protein
LAENTTAVEKNVYNMLADSTDADHHRQKQGTQEADNRDFCLVEIVCINIRM